LKSGYELADLEGMKKGMKTHHQGVQAGIVLIFVPFAVSGFGDQFVIYITLVI
jgi:hypothetical protein